MKNATPHPQGAAQGAGQSRLTLRAIIPLLRNAQQLSGGKWKASCPVPTHGRGRGDVNPSLELWEQDGRLRLKCHAGCDSRMVYRELARLAGHSRTQQPEPRGGSEEPEGLTLQQFGEARRLDVEQLRRWGVSDALYNGRPAVRFNYWDTDGQLRAVQYRLALEGSERFKWRRGGRPRLYGEWRLGEWQAQGAATLWAVEGVSDALTLWHAGLAAIGFPSASSGSLAREFWSHAAQFERIHLSFDCDLAGEQLLQAVARECPPELRERAFVVRLPAPHKDPSELWFSLNTDADAFRAEIQKLGNSATPLIDFPSFRVSETRSLLRPLGEIIASRGIGELEFLDLLGAGNLLVRGCTTLIASHPKAGKTTFLVHACRQWLQEGLKVVYLTEETGVIWRERARKFPELENLYLNEVGHASPEAWTEAVREMTPDVCVIDVVRRFLNLYDESDAAEVSRALRCFTDLTRELPRLALVALHHTRKGATIREASVLDATGSHAFVGEVDAVLLLLPTEHPRQRVLAPVAGRLWHATPPPLCFELSEDGTEYTCLGEAEPVARETEERVGKQQVVYALAQLGESTAADLAEWLQQNEGAKYTKQWTQVLLNALVRGGRAIREGTGKRGDAYRYRLPDDDSETQKLGKPIKEVSEFSSFRNGDADFEQQLQLLQQGELGIDADEAEQLRLVWREASARGFPAMWLGDQFVPRGRVGWLEALPLIAAAAEQALLLLREQPPPPPPTPRQQPLFGT